MFVDQVEITVEAGHGGNGAATFRREKFVPRGGPSGGDGGRGGSIILEVDPNLSTLLDFRYNRQYRAPKGLDGMAKKRDGGDGDDLVIRVPPGTVVTDLDTGAMVADLTGVGQRAVVARGGAGGKGNRRFATAVRQAPSFSELGEPGERRRLRLDLKLVADAGVIGFPSVGKSTLIAAASAARPKIAEYPFTTLTPNLGLVRIGPSESFVLADMPGLVEGAHAGAGLGDRFLRHIERTQVLVHMLDVSDVSERDPLQDFRSVNWELALHSAELAARPQIVALNKTDIVTDTTRVDALATKLERDGWTVFPISAATHYGVSELLLAVWRMVQLHRPDSPAEATEDHAVIRGPERTHDRDWSVHRDAEATWVVEGVSLERLVRRTDLQNDEAVRRLQHTLERTGVHRRLRELGARHEDNVRIGETTFTFDDEDQEHVKGRRRRKKSEPA